MKQLLILMLVSVLFVPMVGSAKADEVLYCQSELATGMKKVNGTWKTGNFTKDRYTIKVFGDFERVAGLYADFQFECQFPYPVSYPRQVVCQHINGNTFIYDKSSKRFIYSLVNTATYVETSSEDTPVIRAGTCEKF